MKWRVKKNFEEGLSWGTHLYGYKYENNQYEIIPEEAKVVKKIFDLFINEIKATDTLNLEFNDKLFNLTIINIKVYKDSHLEFNFKDGSTINIEL